MLYNLLYPLADQYTFLNVFQYITFRAAYALITALVLSWLFGSFFIRWLKTKQSQGNLFGMMALKVISPNRVRRPWVGF